MACKYPDRWLDYSSIGAQVEGTQFIALKVPLAEKFFIKREEESFTPSDAVQQIPNLGLVIDLTFTSKYYNPSEFEKLNVQHKKIFTKGHEVPKRHLVNNFIRTVNDFLAEEENKDKLIGVHCTHGLNRTGYFVCAYMILVQGLEPKSAISAFNDARAHKMERANYLNSLRSLSPASYNPEPQTHNDGQEAIHDANHSRDRSRRAARGFDSHHSDGRNGDNWRDRSRNNGNWRDRSREASNWRDRPRENRNGFLLEGGTGGNWRDGDYRDNGRYNRDDRQRNRSRENHRSYGRYDNHHRDAWRSNGGEGRSSGYVPRNGEPHHNRYKWSRKANDETINGESNNSTQNST